MRDFINILPILLLFMACAGEYSDNDIEAIVEKKCLAALKCDSDSEIIQASIDIIYKNNNDSGDTNVNFSGTYVGKRGVKYEGEIKGKIILGETEELQELYYKNPLDNGNVKNACLNF